MEDKNTSSTKKRHMNRFQYLLNDQNSENIHQKAQQFNLFDFNICLGDPCRNQALQSELIRAEPKHQEQNNLLTMKNNRKPLKFQLQSDNYQIFKQKIQEKSSSSSFQMYTPQKYSDIEYLSIYNDFSTIQNNNSKQNEHKTKPNQVDPNQDRRRRQIDLENKQIQDFFIPIRQKITEKQKNLKVELIGSIRLQKVQNLAEVSQFFPINRRNSPSNRKHSRTLTQNASREGQKFHDSHQRTVRCPKLQQDDLSLKFSQQAKTNKEQTILVKQSEPLKRYCLAKPTVMKTKQMSNKLRESSFLNFDNSIDTIPINQLGISERQNQAEQANSQDYQVVRTVKIKKKIKLTQIA